MVNFHLHNHPAPGALQRCAFVITETSQQINIAPHSCTQTSPAELLSLPLSTSREKLRALPGLWRAWSCSLKACELLKERKVQPSSKFP